MDYCIVSVLASSALAIIYLARHRWLPTLLFPCQCSFSVPPTGLFSVMSEQQLCSSANVSPDRRNGWADDCTFGSSNTAPEHGLGQGVGVRCWDCFPLAQTTTDSGVYKHYGEGFNEREHKKEDKKPRSIYIFN